MGVFGEVSLPQQPFRDELADRRRTTLLLFYLAALFSVIAVSLAAQIPSLRTLLFVLAVAGAGATGARAATQTSGTPAARHGSTPGRYHPAAENTEPSASHRTRGTGSPDGGGDARSGSSSIRAAARIGQNHLDRKGREGRPPGD